jgi:hypothetical protein
VRACAGVPHFGYRRHVVMPILFSAAVGGGAFFWALLRDEDQRAARCAGVLDQGSSGCLARWSHDVLRSFGTVGNLVTFLADRNGAAAWRTVFAVGCLL